MARMRWRLTTDGSTVGMGRGNSPRLTRVTGPNPGQGKSQRRDDMNVCGICEGPLELLGQLADLYWARCRDCGMDQTVELENE